MLYNIIQDKVQLWLESRDCTVKEMIKYIRKKGKLRDTQIEAIETYLFLKIKGDNKPLWKLFAEGFFIPEIDLSDLHISEKTRNYLKTHTEALALYNFATQKTTSLLELEKLIIENPETIDYEKIIKSIFYNVNYPDYLMSLPMGAGKTFLMAAFIYLDLYFADNEPENKNFAHNFLVLIPNGLKTSISPSLRTIEHFDPSWVLPEPSASKMKQILKFTILDKAKSGSKSNKVQNPNSPKINQCLPDPFGQVFVVNAEKVILNRTYLDENDILLDVHNNDKDRRANELRDLIGKIPNLSIFIDEVHHAANDDIKLRQVVNHWNTKGNITTILGFSGTPYISKADKIQVSKTMFFKFEQMTNTVYYYPLTTAIKSFLKNPTVKFSDGLKRLEIIRQGIKDFDSLYKNKTYDNGAIAKIAVYCSNISTLEEQVYPFLLNELKINPNEILRFHKGNKDYKLPAKNEQLFRSLDTPQSKKRYLLLVQIGKEGWDCQSLTGVILSQKGDSPKNMVLQVSCRCLRQVDKNKDETAIIWLNKYNADILNTQLKKEQNITIDELNKLKGIDKSELINRYSRIEYLQLPPIEFYQLNVTYSAINEESSPNTKQKLNTIIKEIDSYQTPVLIKTGILEDLDKATINILEHIGSSLANYNHWLFEISKNSFNKITLTDLNKYSKELQIIFDKITFEENGRKIFNTRFDQYFINSKIRLAFSIKRKLQSNSETINKKANLLIIDKLKPVEYNDKLYPNKQQTTNNILKYDESKTNIAELEIKQSADYEKAKKLLIEQGLGDMAEGINIPKSIPNIIKQKDKTLHYIPYDFKQSGFEKEILETIIQLKVFQNKRLEVYYNGERGLTQFVINCLVNDGGYWKNIGKYTSDFLIIKRKDKNIHKVLIIETKGKGYENDPVFIQKKNFVSNEFLNRNKEKFGYQRFDFIHLVDSDNINTNIVNINTKINDFFK